MNPLAALLSRPYPSPILLHGPPGAGKTTLAARVAAELGRSAIIVPCHRGTDAADLLATLELRASATGHGTETVRALGPVAEGLRDGAIIVLDDLDRIAPSAAIALMQVLEGGSRKIETRAGSFDRDSRSAIIATANSDLAGSATGAYAASPQDAALADRFSLRLKMDPPTRDAVAGWIAARAPTLPPATVRAIARAASDAALGGAGWTTRSALALAEALEAGLPPETAAALTTADDRTAATIAAYLAASAI